jgi:anthranilate phosphoribosyltransferase
LAHDVGHRVAGRAVRDDDRDLHAGSLGHALPGLRVLAQDLVAGAALFVSGKAASVRDGLTLAAAAIDSGAARTTLDRMVRMSQEGRAA